MLSLLIWLPAATALLGALLPGPRHGVRGRAWAGRLVAAGALASFGIAVALIVDYSPGSGLTHVTDIVWIPALGIHYKLGVDGLNLFLVGLATLLFALSVIAANLRDWPRAHLFFFHLGLAESAVLGALVAQDLALFVAFFDLMLIPFYFLVGVWGSGERVRATTKLVIYTLVGSLLMLAAAIATAVLSAQAANHGLTFVLSDLRAAPVPAGSADWIFLFFAAAFLVKMPAFPLHGWMPDGYRAMPIEALMVFSGVLSKVGAYGFLRIVLPLFPGATAHFQTLLLLIGLASILYGSAMAFTQTNARLIAGYSSVAQLGFITLGIFSLTPQGAQGAVLQMVNHGLVVAPLFFIIYLLADRAGGSEDVRDMGGIAMRAPVLAATFLIVAMASLAIPGSGNFAGEFMILLGVFNTKVVISIVAFAGVVMAAVYMLRVFIRAVHNRTGPHVVPRELRARDGLVLAPFIAAIVFFALYPQFELHRAEKSVVGSVAQARAVAAGHARVPTAALTPALYAPARTASSANNTVTVTTTP
ncbi:MAG: NADH-quinone oxidoreductase subunit M [Actinobacteria bacterium]|nr:NADH-quinone oxidoreductase subunit M [Actinomycetota bacterium]